MYIYIYIFLVFFEIGTKRTKQERQTLLKYFDLNLKKMIMKVSQSIFLEEQMSEVKYCFFLMASMINDNESTEEKSTFFSNIFRLAKACRHFMLTRVDQNAYYTIFIEVQKIS